MASVVIAAHNEEAVIGRCLESLLRQEDAGDLRIVVVANGCTDRTVAVAESYGVQVVELLDPGKAQALIVGDAQVEGFPRIYLDADIELPRHAVAAIEQAFASDSTVMALAPSRRVATVHSTLPVRAYFAINQRLPAFHNSLFGRGVIVLSEQGRSEFDTFPVVVADDLYLDSLYSEDQKRELASVEVTVTAPTRTGPLLQRLARVRRGNAQLRQVADPNRPGQGVRRSDRLAWLTEVVLPNPQLAPAAAVYVVLTVIAGVRGRRQTNSTTTWGRDETSRESRGAGDEGSRR
ncbi:glycosyltransferase [uncultured Friedmanniella sp.]|uniref:glycosyltransferase n=1 Tax=uncultured Friedmanniella sp. TaxID=335381 RepID=UPI0035CAD68B